MNDMKSITLSLLNMKHQKRPRICKKKFPGKVLLRLAISELGVSEPIFFKGGLAVNANFYREKCIPELEKVIKKYHKN